MIGELVVSGAISLVMVILLIVSFSFEKIDIGGSLGPGGWPQAVIILALVLNLILIFKIVKLRKTGLDAKGKISLPEVRSFALSTGFFVLFIFLLKVIGFFWSAPILMFAFMFQLGVRKAKPLIITPLVTSVAVTELFGRLMEVSLPRGIGFFRVLTYYLY